MTPDQYHLCKIAEECNEVAQRAMKAQQFGLGEIQPGQSLSNMERLVSEFHDLYTTFECLVDCVDGFEMKPSPKSKGERISKMKKFLQLSKNLHQVDENTEI